MHLKHAARGSCERGQLGFDFLVGMSVFLISLGFVLGFVPGMFDPFVGGTSGDMIIADRSAAHLSDNALVDSTTDPGVLNTTCTVAFFNDSIPSTCRVDTAELPAALGVHRSVSVNATIQNEGTVRSIDGVALESGPVPSDLGSVSVAQRVVFLDGESSRLYVRVW